MEDPVKDVTVIDENTVSLQVSEEFMEEFVSAVDFLLDQSDGTYLDMEFVRDNHLYLITFQKIDLDLLEEFKDEIV